MKKLHVILAVMLISVLLLGSFACAPKPQVEEEIKVGSIMSIAGVFAALGDPEKKGLELAIEEINKAGGVAGKQLKLILYDDEGDTGKSVALANRLIHEDKVSVILGPNITPTAGVVVPIAEEAKVLLIGVVAQEYWWKGTDYIFMTIPRQFSNAEVIVRHAVEDLKAKTAGIFYCDCPYSTDGLQFLKENAATYGLEIVVIDKWGETDFEFTPQVIKAVKAKPDVIFLWGSGAVADALMVKQLREAGVTVPISGDITLSMPYHLETGGAAMEGLYSFTWLNYDYPSKLEKAFLDAYKAKYGEVPANISASTYDAVYVYKNAVEQAGGKTDPVSVAAAMLKVEFESVTGHFKFTRDNHTGLTPDCWGLIQVQGGKWVAVAE